MSKFTILRDSREQEGYGYYFEDYPVDVTEVKLETGDYAVQQPGYYGSNGAYLPPFAVERKAKKDFLKSITHDRERFEREIERADEWEAPMPIVVEEPWFTFQQGNYWQDVPVNSVLGTVQDWPGYKNCDFFFKNDEDDAERFTYEMLDWWYSRQ